MNPGLIAIIAVLAVTVVIVGVLMLIWRADKKQARKKQKAIEDEKIKIMTDLQEDGFTVDKMLFCSGVAFAVDVKAQRVFFGTKTGKKYVDFKDIVKFELSENGQLVSNALAGGLLFGVTGAVVGATMKKDGCTSLRINVTINDIINPVISLELMPPYGAYKNSDIYKQAIAFAQEVVATLSVIGNKTSSAGE